MQQDNNIENKLRHLEEDQSPDLSSMDAHWQQMAAMLQPAALPVKKGWPKWMLNALTVLTVAIMITAALWYLSAKKDAGTPAVAEQLNAPQNETAVLSISRDSSSNETAAATTPAPVVQYEDPANGFGNDFMEAAVAPVFDSLKINFTDCKTCPSKKTDSQVAGINRTQLLQNLFSQLKKPEQHFLVNNNRDTLLFGTEGTSLFIPAWAFNGMDSVNISLKEYYKYSEMIMNRLITKSDDEQLISGGMFNIQARRNDQPLTLNKNNPIMVFVPGITAKDSFQIFQGDEQVNSALKNSAGNKINWQLSDVSIDSPVSRMFIRALDLRDNTAGIFYGKKTKAVFTMSRKSELTKEQLKDLLQKKYGSYYDKIKVKQQWERSIFFKQQFDNYDYEWGNWVGNSWGVGDTAELTPNSIRTYKLQPIDTVYKVLYWVHKGMRRVNLPVLTENMKAKIAEKYSIQLDKLGWINCDRFNKVSGPKENYIVDLKDSSYNYYTMLIFDKYKSLLSGTYVNNTMVAFYNIPANEPFKIVSIGINKDGEPVYAMKEGIYKSSIIDGLRFEPISAPGLKTALSKMDQ